MCFMHSHFTENPPIDVEVTDPSFLRWFYHSQDLWQMCVVIQFLVWWAASRTRSVFITSKHSLLFFASAFFIFCKICKNQRSYHTIKYG
jgi:hypothetical protein